MSASHWRLEQTFFSKFFGSFHIYSKIPTQQLSETKEKKRKLEGKTKQKNRSRSKTNLKLFFYRVFLN